MSKSKKQARVGFLSFFKLSFLYGLALGQLAGLGFLLVGIAGGPVDLNLGPWRIQGLPAAIGGLFLMPLVFGLLAIVVAPFLFWPFALAVRVFGSFDAS